MQGNVGSIPTYEIWGYFVLFCFLKCAIISLSMKRWFGLFAL